MKDGNHISKLAVASLVLAVLAPFYLLWAHPLGSFFGIRSYAFLFATAFVFPTTAILLGVIAFARLPPGSLRARGKRLVIVSILIALADLSILPPMVQLTRQRSRHNACIGNLCIMNAAKEQYALEHGLTNGAVISPEVLRPWLKIDWERESCPDARSNTYILGRIGELPRCAVHGELYSTHLP